jgi:outer membrane protein
MRRLAAGVAALALSFTAATTAIAGDYNGNFMVRLQATQVMPDDQVNSLTAGGADLKAAGFDADVSDRFLPTATLTYFLTKNIGLELFCCFSKHNVDVSLNGANLGKAADFWIFPPALTLQYHFDGMGAFKPYLGVGGQWIHFFNESTSSNPLVATSVNIKDAFGITLQAGVDVAIGNGWYLNFDVKKTWLDTTATWRNSLAAGGADVVAKVDIDPLIISGGIGYRFNLEDVFGHRMASYEPMK